MSNHTRPGWDHYFMKLAHDVSSRGTCDRKRVGAVVVVDSHIVATGYNGSIPGLAHCDDVGHDMEDGHCVRTMHAEANAVAQAALLGRSLKDAAIYCNTFPCWPCFKLLVSAGVRSVYYDEEYRIDERVNAAVEASHRYVPGGYKLMGPKQWMLPIPSFVENES